MGSALTIEKMRAAIAALTRQEEARRTAGPIMVFIAPRSYQGMLDVARPSRRWARRYIRLSRRASIGLDHDQAYRDTPRRRFTGRTALARRVIRERVRPVPSLPRGAR